MPKLTVSEPAFDKSRNRWKVTVPAGLATSGKRIRSWHSTREAARTYIDNLTKSEPPSAIISPELAMEADKARSILEPWHLDLVQVARDHAAALKVLDGAGSVLDAVKAYRAAHNARTASKLMGEAVPLYTAAKTKLRPATLSSYKHTLEGVFAPLHDRMLADITTADIEELLKDKPDASRALNRRNLLAFWTWCSKKPRSWALASTVKDIEAPPATSDEDIVILKHAEVRALLKSAEALSPAAAAAYAIAVFAGVRMAELGRLTWGDIGEDNIDISKAIAKKHARRLVPICPALRAWLDVARVNVADDDRLVPPNWLEVSKAVRACAGWKVAQRLVENPPKPTRGSWPGNSPRHTCASVQVAIGTPIKDLIFAFGHSGGTDLLQRHYVSRLTKKDALAILAIGPNDSKIAHIAVA